MRLSEVGTRIKEQRLALGLTQEQVAKLAELACTKIVQIENGTLSARDHAELSQVLGILGLDLQLRPAKGLEHALSMAARTASTSYKNALTPEVLAEILRSGNAPREYLPHLVTLLDETPLPVVLMAIHEAAARSPSATQKAMRHMAKWAQELGVRRAVW